MELEEGWDYDDIIVQGEISILLDALVEIGHTKFRNTELLHAFVWDAIERYSKSGTCGHATSAAKALSDYNTATKASLAKEDKTR